MLFYMRSLTSLLATGKIHLLKAAFINFQNIPAAPRIISRPRCITERSGSACSQNYVEGTVAFAFSCQLFSSASG